MLQKQSILDILNAINRGYSYRAIAATRRVGRGTVSRIHRLYMASGLSLEQLSLMDDNDFNKVFYAPRTGRTQKRDYPDFEHVYERLHNKNIHTTLTDEWFSYFSNGEQDTKYRRSQFTKLYSDWLHENHPGEQVVMTVFRQPGQYLYIDWVGDQPALVADPSDPQKLLKVHILVTTLGFSSMTWFEAFPAETLPYLIEGMNHALEFYGAVPYALRPDNMPTAVSKNNRTELIFNRTFEDFARHYGVEIHPCRPYKPKDKASVERAVRIIESEFLAPLEGMVFESFEELNKKAAQFCQKLNSRRKAGESVSRLALFKERDLPQMKPLPATKFTLFEYTQKTVPANCYVYFDRHYYSVPYTLCSETVIIKSSEDKVIICDGNTVVAEHERSYETGPNEKLYITDPSHELPEHRYAREQMLHPEKQVLDKAASIGPNMELFIRQLRHDSEFEMQGLRHCKNILNLCKKMPKGQAEEAAALAFQNGISTFAEFQKLLASVCSSHSESGFIPVHENIRGEGEYK